MNFTWPTGYRKRLLLLGVSAALVMALLWKKKLGPAVHSWMQQRSWNAEAVPLDELRTEEHRLLRERAALDRVFGSTGTSDAGWRAVLDLLDRRGATTGVALAGVSTEHVIELDGTTIRTLPLSLKGRTADLVNTIAALEQDSSGAHLLSVDLHAKAIGHDGPRQLTATLYLQTLTR
ncbi:MAG: hypothetical protein JNJ91_12910 [Flavobacteriales bacterium]|nr:hypothetical protein [Flavobacteriales bacterium]